MLWLVMFNLYTTFEVSSFTLCKDKKGVGQSRYWIQCQSVGILSVLCRGKPRASRLLCSIECLVIASVTLAQYHHMTDGVAVSVDALHSYAMRTHSKSDVVQKCAFVNVWGASATFLYLLLTFSLHTSLNCVWTDHFQLVCVHVLRKRWRIHRKWSKK